jgi:glucan phosphoethanolaminetransferase (alkaline phosphatase superfamily)
LTKPLLALLLVVVAFATHFMQHYGVYLDPSMLRNVLRTDVAESPASCCPGAGTAPAAVCRAAAAAAVARAPAAPGLAALGLAWRLGSCCWRWRCWWAR